MMVLLRAHSLHLDSAAVLVSPLDFWLEVALGWVLPAVLEVELGWESAMRDKHTRKQANQS